MRFIALLFAGLALVAGGARAEEAKGWIGAVVADVTGQETGKLGWSTPHGAKVMTVAPGSPAAKTGLKAGDVITAVDKMFLDNAADFNAAIAGKAPGTGVKLRFVRKQLPSGAKEMTVAVTLAARPVVKAVKDAPIPMLDAGGHMARIKGIAFTPDGRQLVSAGYDKTIRVWDVATGKTVRTIRGEVATGDAGKIYAMALSPDGKQLAVGGWTGGNEIRLYNFATGKLVALLKGHEDTVHALAFSPDGRYLISGQGGDNPSAIIWDVAAARAKHWLRGHMGSIYAVGFTPDGQRAVTGSDDQDLRLWRVADGVEIARMPGHGERIRSLAVAPDGTIASGDWLGEIRLWDGKTGAFRKTLAWRQTLVGSLSFSPDGKKLLSSCGYGNCASFPETVYDVASGREIVTYHGHDNSVFVTAISPDGRWAATGGGNDFSIHIWDLANGQRRPGLDGQPLTLGGRGKMVWAVGFAADGQRIAWGTTPDHNSPRPVLSRGPLEYALTLPSGDAPLRGPVLFAGSAGASWRRATAELNGWTLSLGTDAILDITQDGRRVASIERGPSDGYIHRSYSFTHDGETIISGGAHGVLTAYDRAGNSLGDFIGHEGDIWGVAASPDGRYLVSGAADQTVRLWNLKTRELLVTLYHGKDGEWVMWTPQGYFAASPAGAELIGWQINRGPENAAEYVTAAQLRTKLNRPDIVAKAIRLASAEEAVRQSPGTNFKLSGLLKKPVPRIRIVSPAANATLTGGSTQLELALAATPDPVKAIRIQVNGVQIAEHQPASGPGFKPGTLKFPVPLAKGLNTIRVVAVNQQNLETPAEVTVTHDGRGALDKRGTLYIIAIGVDKYPNLGKVCTELDNKTPKTCDLRVAGADAKSFAKTMAARLGSLHERAESLVLVNGGKRGEPTQDNILDALGMMRKAKENDTVVMFVSGHGINEGLSYNFLSTDAALGAGGLRNSTIVPWANFQLALAGAKGRRILFLDTCHSGNRFDDRLLGDAYQANIVVYAAARWDQEALERADLGHGLFTLAVVEAMKGKAKNAAGEVRTEGMRDYLKVRVGELAKQMMRRQEPQYYRGRDARNYLLAREQ